MKIGAGLLLWALIAVIFFRWAAAEERRNRPGPGTRDLDGARADRDGTAGIDDATRPRGESGRSRPTTPSRTRRGDAGRGAAGTAARPVRPRSAARPAVPSCGASRSDRQARRASSCARTAALAPVPAPGRRDPRRSRFFAINISRIFLAASRGRARTPRCHRRGHHHARDPRRRHGHRRAPEAPHVVARASAMCGVVAGRAARRLARARREPAEDRGGCRLRRADGRGDQHARGRRAPNFHFQADKFDVPGRRQPRSSTSTRGLAHARVRRSRSSRLPARGAGRQGRRRRSSCSRGPDVHDLLHAPGPPGRRHAGRRSRRCRRAASPRPGPQSPTDDHGRRRPTTTTAPRAASPRSTRPRSPAPAGRN